MSVTGLSTGVTNAYIDAMPPEHAALVRRACDCYSKQCDKAQLMRDAKTAKCEAKVIEAIHAKRARLENKHRCFWTQILLEHYFQKRKIVVDEDVVRRVVKSFPGFL